MSNSALQDLIRAEEAQICFLKRQLSIHDERLGLLQRLLSEDLRPARLVETDEPFGNKLGISDVLGGRSPCGAGCVSTSRTP